MTKLIKPKRRFKDLSEKEQKLIYGIVSNFIDTANKSVRKRLLETFQRVGREKTEEIIVDLIDKGCIRIIETERGYIFETYDRKKKKYV